METSSKEKLNLSDVPVFCRGIRGQEMIHMDLFLAYQRNYSSYHDEIFTQDAHHMPHDEGVKKNENQSFWTCCHLPLDGRAVDDGVVVVNACSRNLSATS